MEDRAEVEAEAEAESSSSASTSSSSSSCCESSSSSDSASVALSEITSALSPCGAMSCEGDESGRANNGASVSSRAANPRNPNGHNRYRRVKFLCSFGGRILPRPLDGKLRYVGGETRIISVGRDICFRDFVARVSEICPEEAFVIKYQLPEEEDLDSLVSVLCDDDLANMMEEYDKLEADDGFTRLRVFLFPSAENIDPFDPSIVVCSAGTADADGDQRYVDALNGVVMSMSRSESMNSLTNFVDSVGSGSLPRLVTPHVVLPNSPHHSLSGHGSHSHSHSHHHVLHHHMSPPVSPHPISPLGHVMHSFEDSEVYHYQEQQQQQQQQGWSVGGHYNISEMPAPIGSNVPTYRDPLKPTNFSHAVPPEILQCDDHSRMPFNHKQLLKVYPANENYVGNSPEYNSPRDLQNHMDASNHWYEENHRPISDMLPSPSPYGHPSSQQQGPYTVSGGYHVADTPRASDFGSPRFSQRANVIGHACPQNRRPENMQHGDIHHVIKHSDVESHWHASYHNQCDGLQRNNAQHYLKCCEGEGQWHNSSNYHECYDEINSEHMPSRSLHGKPVLQTAIPHAAIYEGAVRTEAPHPVIDDGHSRNLGSQKHLQTIWSQNYCSVAECNERHPDYTNVQSSGHMEYRNSHSSYRMYSRPVPSEEIGLPTDRAGIGQVMYEGNSMLERYYDRQITSEVNISARLVEQVSSRDKVHLRRPEGYVHQPSCLLPKELAVRMENMNEEQLVPSVNKPNMDMGYEDRLDRARDWVMRSRNSNCDPIDGVCLPVLTKVETVNNVSNYPPDHACRCCYGMKTTVYNQDVPALSDKLQTVTPVEHLALTVVDHPAHSLACMHVDGTPMALSHQTEKLEEAIVGPNNILEIVADQRKIEEYDIVHSQTSYKINPADCHNMSVYMSDDLSLKDAANVGNEVAAQKSLHIAHNIKVENPDEQPKLRKVIKGQELNVLPSLESKITKNEPSSSQGRVPSRPEVLDTLYLPSTAEVLLSALSSSHLAKTDTQSPGPPIYDKSPENSIDLGQDDSGARGKDEKEKETENLEVKDGAVQHLNEPGSMHVKTSFIKNSPNITIEDAVNSEAVKYPESTVSDVANGDEGKHVPTESPKSGEELQVKEPSRTSSHKKSRTGDKQALKEKYLSSDDGENDISLNLGNSSLAPEIQARAKGFQIIKNDDLEDVRELGSGTYGTVYYGRWKGSDVAIKRIKASFFTCDKAEQEKLLSDFWKEARILSKLHHPNVVAFYGIVLDGPDGTMATVTEYMVNGSLKQVLNKKDRTIDRKKRIILAREAAFGMEYLHEKNIVHFDLKCDNLLVNMKDPQRPICKIGDLGLSKIKQRTLVSGGVRGTLPWMAPELLSGKSGMVTEKVDVFSFGIVMWELLTGEEPYAKMHCGEIIGGILNNTLRPEIPHWCEPSWRSLMERCWSPETAERPSFSVIAAELRAMGEAINLK